MRSGWRGRDVGDGTLLRIAGGLDGGTERRYVGEEDGNQIS
jgi:hypothetical protein